MRTALIPNTKSRFLFAVSPDHYPSGGFSDVLFGFEDLSELEIKLPLFKVEDKGTADDEFQILDTTTGKVYITKYLSELLELEVLGS